MFYLQYFTKRQDKQNNLRNKYLIASKVLIMASILTLLSACQTYRIDDGWPKELPKRQLFIQGYLDKRQLNTATDAELAYHLGWIKKFYQGTTLYPNGWLRASEQFLATINSQNLRNNIEKRLSLLGIKIGNEWAQDNSIRLINNSNIATWGSAMRTAAERSEQLSFLVKVEQDVNALLEKQLNARNIKYKRYFTEESYDDF